MTDKNFTLPGTTINLNRLGYGAMQLAGPHVFGPPRDMDVALAVLRKAVELGINHIDTADFYGPHVTNQIIKKALHPYPESLTIVTKVGARRNDAAAWLPALSKQELTNAIQDNLKNLGVDVLDIVNLRVGPPMRAAEGPITEAFSVLVELQRAGLIRHLGLSNITPTQFANCQKLAPVVCVQNLYNIVNRHDDQFIDDLGRQGIAYVPYFPLGGFTPLQSSVLNKVANELAATPMQVALAWLYQRAKHILLIPGTASLQHLDENFNATTLTLSSEMMAELNLIAGKPKS
jgi:pyridoxine 4-dehydrogenase